MSDLLQSANYSPGPQSGGDGLGREHPDTDQLNAFVEHTLPEHERLETLAHLADCANCREIVSLSLPPLEDAGTVEPVPVAPSRLPGSLAGLFSGWNVVWIAAPALAGVVVLTFYLRNLPASRHPAGQIADSRPPARPAPPPVAAGPQPPKPSPPPKAAPGRPADNKANPKLAVEQPRRVEDRTVSGREAVTPKPQPLVPAAPVYASPLRAAPAKASQAAGGPELRQRSMARTAPSAGALLAAPRASGSASGFLREPPRGATVVPITPMAPDASESAPAPAGGVQPAEVNQTVVFASGAAATVGVAADSSAMMMNAQSSALDAVIAAREVPENAAGLAPLASARLAQAPLPSGRAVLSLAANLHRRLALDTRNQLFFSPDDGQHWKQIPAVWRGRAVTVATVPVAAQYAPAHTPALALAVPERYTPGATASEHLIAGSSSSVSGAVTDASGAVIPGATVSAIDSRTALVRAVQADAAGRYLVQELPPGDYRLEARAPGFAPHSQIAVVGESQRAVINIALAVGQSAQTVAVEASPPVQLHTFSRNMLHGTAKARNANPPAPIDTLSPLFVITTDAGSRWTSTDGQSWKQE